MSVQGRRSQIAAGGANKLTIGSSKKLEATPKNKRTNKQTAYDEEEGQIPQNDETKALTTPQTANTNSKSNEDLMPILTQILQELKDLKKENLEFKNETRQEIMDMKEELRKRDENWEKKHENLDNKLNGAYAQLQQKLQQMEQKIKYIETAEEYRKRREKKNNIIIKRKDMIPTDNDVEDRKAIDTKVKNILSKLVTNTEYFHATYLGKDSMNRGLTRVVFNRFKDKMDVMTNKSKLQGQECFIDNDFGGKENTSRTETEGKGRTRQRQTRSSGLPENTNRLTVGKLEGPRLKEQPIEYTEP